MNNNKYYDRHISLPEVLKKVSELKGTVDEKSKLLSMYDGKSLRWLVNAMYFLDIDKLTLPTEYKKCKSPYGFTPMSFGSAIPKIEAAIKNRDNIQVFNRHFMLVLENLHPSESDLILDVLSGKKIEGVSKAVFKRTYPSYFPDDLEEIE